jgi:2-oxoisovalerate dehydrogenase E1 component
MTRNEEYRLVEVPQIKIEDLFYRMALIRRFEERLLDCFQTKQLTGTTHTYLGQEATAVAALSMLNPGDLVCAQHRSHGYFIAASGDPRALFLEILGDIDGVCNGVGGSQHLFTDNFLSNGILGGTPGVATGAALAQKLRGDGGVVVSFIGDGTLGEGLIYESFNIAALWRLPVLFVIENNRYSQTTPIDLNLAGSIRGRTEAFGITTNEIESNDVVELIDRFAAALAHVRKGQGPFCQIVHTYRLGPHSKGDDLRPEAERERWIARDPLRLAKKRLGRRHVEILQRADDNAAKATEMPPSIRSISLDTLTDDRTLIPQKYERETGWRLSDDGQRLVTHLQKVFRSLLETYPEIYLLGEDILDPYGGAFKVYSGLSTAFPGRVLATPVSEAAIVAVANGLALRGYRPIVEIMFGDFATLAFDQILNHATKFARVYRHGTSCPVILRTPFGGYRGYGPTHSQSLEKLFLGIPGLVVTTSDVIHDPRLIWERMLHLSSPCLHIENKGLYGAQLPRIAAEGQLALFRLYSSGGYFPTTTLSLNSKDDQVDLTLIAYGGMVAMAMEAARSLFREYEILAEVVVPSQLAPLPTADLSAAVARSKALLIMEEGTERAGFGAEVIANLSCLGLLKGKRVARCAALDTVIPNNAELERAVLPSLERLIRLAREVCACR